MPSDPSGTKPSGVLTRAAADFFDDHMAFGGFNYLTDPPVGNTFVSISLFNNATTGVVFKVYGIASGNDNVGSTYAYMLQGPPLGTLVGNCASIRLDQGAPYGQIYQQIDTEADPTDLYPRPFPPSTMVLGVATVGGSTILSPFPLFIVPVGYSLVIANSSSASQVWGGFWFQQANE